MPTITNARKAIAEGKSQKFPGGNVMDTKERVPVATIEARIRVSPEAPESAQAYNDDLRGTLTSAIGEINKILVDRDLSAQGREKRARDRAVKAIESVNKSVHAQMAFDSMEGRMEKLESALTAERKPLSTQHELMLAREIRAHIASISEKKRADWARQNQDNPLVARAILTAAEAPFLFGMDSKQVEDFEDRAQRALHPEEYAERELLRRTDEELARSTKAANELLTKAAGIRLARDGETWLSESEKDTTPRENMTEKMREAAE